MAGRPTIYTKELAVKICAAIASTNNSLRTICKDNSISVSTLFEWLANNPEFSELYARAKEAQTELLVDEMLTIADDSNGDDAEYVGINRIHRAKLQVDTRKWIASKLKPKKWGDKVDVTSAGEKIQSVNYSHLTTEKLAQIESLLTDDESQ